jgi:hypothetical protein
LPQRPGGHGAGFDLHGQLKTNKGLHMITGASVEIPRRQFLAAGGLTQYVRRGWKHTFPAMPVDAIPTTRLQRKLHSVRQWHYSERTDMELVSVNTGLPREVMWHGRSVTTAIFKEPAEGRVALRKLNLEGDGQADLSVHGGEHKAVYCYPLAHYDYWKRELPGRDLPMAIFGENFTTDGLLEHSIHLGDQLSVGSAEVVVTQPRLPCYKLGRDFSPTTW